MPEAVDLPVILGAAFIASASPGPTTFALAGTSMASGRKYGLALAAGITSASLLWSIVAALGFSALMLTNAWILESIRYLGASYLMFLAYKSAKSALRRDQATTRRVGDDSLALAYSKGLVLHLTNPKAVLFFGSLYAIGIPAGTSPSALATVIALVGLQSCTVFHGYALLFSCAPMTRGYLRLRRWLEAVFALAFAAASLKILTARLQ